MRHPNMEGIRVNVPAGDVSLEGDLFIPERASGIVVFAHGSGSSRHSPRNRFVAETLHEGRLGTLLFDLLTAKEEIIDLQTTKLRFDIALLAERLMHAIDWVHGQDPGRRLGLFGASTGAGAALLAAAARAGRVQAVVSRGGRPDLAGSMLSQVECPTLFIVGGRDRQVIELNRMALGQMKCERKLEIVPRATHLFEEPGALDDVASMAREWFEDHLSPTLARERASARISEGL